MSLPARHLPLRRLFSSSPFFPFFPSSSSSSFSSAAAAAAATRHLFAPPRLPKTTTTTLTTTTPLSPLHLSCRFFTSSAARRKHALQHDTDYAKSPSSVPQSQPLGITANSPTADHDDTLHNNDEQHRMLIGFTCKVCSTRQHKTMSRRAYLKGVVLIQCDGCSNRHLIADNLGWFRDKNVNVEDLVREKGEAVRKLYYPSVNGVVAGGAAQLTPEGMIEYLPVEEREVAKQSLLGRADNGPEKEDATKEEQRK